MKPVDIVVLAVIVLLLGLVCFFLYRSKKKGVKCIGCPDGSSCSGKCGSCSDGGCCECGRK